MIQEIVKKDQATIIRLQGALEIGKQEKLKDDLLKHILPGNPKVVLDFKGVDFIDSACLGSLISISKKLKEKGGDIRIAALQEEVRSIFQITRLDKVFRIFDKTDEAVASYAA